MPNGTIINQGSFTSDGNEKRLNIRSDVDWMYVYNYTNAENQDDDSCVFYWQRGMDIDTGMRWFKDGASNNLNLLTMTSGGFSLLDTAANPIGSAIAMTNVTNATQPVITTGSTGSLSQGSIVRFSSISALPNLGGIDFEVTSVSSNNFTVRWPLANAPGAVGSDGNYRHIKYDPIFYPRRRYIADISQAQQAVITFTVSHGYNVGDALRIHVDPTNDMTEINGQKGTVLAVDTGNNTVTVDIDTSGYTAFAFQAPGDSPFNPAHAVPFGFDTAEALDANASLIEGSTENKAIIGMLLAAGADAPGGADNDEIYWVAGRSFRVDNE